jgi:hypothetical protein
MSAYPAPNSCPQAILVMLHLFPRIHYSPYHRRDVALGPSTCFYGSLTRWLRTFRGTSQKECNTRITSSKPGCCGDSPSLGVESSAEISAASELWVPRTCSKTPSSPPAWFTVIAFHKGSRTIQFSHSWLKNEISHFVSPAGRNDFPRRYYCMFPWNPPTWF